MGRFDSTSAQPGSVSGWARVEFSGRQRVVTERRTLTKRLLDLLDTKLGHRVGVFLVGLVLSLINGLSLHRILYYSLRLRSNLRCHAEKRWGREPVARCRHTHETAGTKKEGRARARPSATLRYRLAARTRTSPQAGTAAG